MLKKMISFQIEMIVETLVEMREETQKRLGRHKRTHGCGKYPRSMTCRRKMDLIKQLTTIEVMIAECMLELSIRDVLSDD